MSTRVDRRTVLRGLVAAAGVSAAGALTVWEMSGAEFVGNTVRSSARIPQPYVTAGTVPRRAAPDLVDAEGDHYRFVQRRRHVEILPGYRTEIWGYEGEFPGPTIRARRGRPVELELVNDLDVPTVLHLHGGHTPADSDGYPTDLILPRHPSAHAGMHAGPHAPDPMARVVTGSRMYIYPNQQNAATLWYHDHRMDFTGAAVWRGLAGMYVIDDPAEDQLGLPTGGQDLPMMLSDRSFDQNGQLLYPALDPTATMTPGVTEEFMMGVLGDVMLVNGVPWPRYRVPGVRHRLRWLNASNARVYRLRTVSSNSQAPGLVQIGSDGGLLAAPQELHELNIAPGERFDTILDLSGHRVGDVVTVVNDLGEGQMVEVARFEVADAITDTSRVPDRLAAQQSVRRADAVRSRDLHFQMGRMADGQHGWLVNGRGFDPSRSDVGSALGELEIWRITSNFNHPVHVHLNAFQVISVNGDEPRATDRGWKDTLNLGAGERAEIAIRFTDYAGRYLVHCHNLEHEDMAMMANVTVHE